MSKELTYSELAEKLSRSKGKFDKLASSTDPAEKFTGERMGRSLDNKLEMLFDVQETLKGEGGGVSYRQGGDPFPNYRITPQVKKLWDDFQFSIIPRDMAKPTVQTRPTTPQTPYKPLPDNVFRNFTRESFNDQMTSKKWNIDGYQKGSLPKDEMSDVFFNAKVKNKWNLDGRDRYTPPQGTVKEAFDRAMGKAKTTPQYYTGINVGFQGEKKPSVPRGTGDTTTPVKRRSEYIPDSVQRKSPFGNELAPKGFRFKPSTGFNESYATPRIGATPKLEPGASSLVGNRFSFAPAASTAKSKLKAGDIVEGIAPFLDNFANLINPTPRIPAPTYFKTPQLETKYNIEPQIQEMRRGLRTSGQQIDRSVGQGNVAAAYKAKTLADYFRASGQAYGTKENTERQLRNQNVMAVSNIDQANAQITNNFNQQNLARNEAERMRRIGLINNLGEDFMTIRNDRLTRELDKDKFAILGNVFKDVIQSNPQMKKLFEDQLAGGVYSKKYGGKIRMKRK